MNVNTRGQCGEKGHAASLAGIEQMKRSPMFRFDRSTGIDVIGPRPGGSRMHVDLVESTIAIDVRPGRNRPSVAGRLLSPFGKTPPGCLLGELVHKADQPLPSIATEFQLACL